jgi:hypothetical protein
VKSAVVDSVSFWKEAANLYSIKGITLELKEEENPCFYTTHKRIALNLELAKFMGICDYHQKISCLFSTEADYITFLSGDNKDKKYYNEGNIVHQWQLYCRFYYSLHPHKKLVLQRKRIRIVVCISTNRRSQCRTMSVLIDEDNVMKIKKAKEIIIAYG